MFRVCDGDKTVKMVDKARTSTDSSGSLSKSQQQK